MRKSQKSLGQKKPDMLAATWSGREVLVGVLERRGEVGRGVSKVANGEETYKLRR